MAYFFANSDFDVWILNLRGNQYSTCDEAVTFDQMIWRDIPEIVDFILLTSCRHKLRCIGLGYGANIMMAACAVHEELNVKVDAIYALHPILQVQGTHSSTLQRVSSPLRRKFIKEDV